MKKNLKKNLFVTLALALAITGTTAFAAVQTTTTTTPQAQAGQELKKGAEKKADFLKTLVSSGAVDQATYDKMVTYMETVKQQNGEKQAFEKKDMFSDLVTNKIITQAQYDAMQAFETKQREAMKEKFANKAESADKKNDTTKKAERFSPFANLVESGKLPQATVDKIEAYMEANRPAKPTADVQKNASATDKATTDKTKVAVERKDMLADLLTNKVITQAEYDAIKAAMPEKPEADKKSPFNRYVTAGIIDQATADKIQTYMEANRPAKEEKSTEPKQERNDIFTSMLADGIITQVQYDAIKTAMPQRTEKENGMGFGRGHRQGQGQDQSQSQPPVQTQVSGTI